MRFTFNPKTEVNTSHEAVNFTEEQVLDIMVAIYTTCKQDVDLHIQLAEESKKKGEDSYTGAVLFSFPELSQAIAEKFEDLTKEQCLFVGVVIATEVERCKKMLDLACIMGEDGIKALSTAMENSIRERQF